MGVMLIKWRTDGDTTWSAEASVDLGSSSDTDFFIKLIHRGIFRTRQYQMTFKDEGPVVVAGMSLDLQKLSH